MLSQRINGVARRVLARVVLTTVLLLPIAPGTVAAQHEGHARPGTPKPDGMQLMMSGPLGIPMSRGGSGTSWLPDAAPMYGNMRSAGRWGVMAHGVVFGEVSAQGGSRGDTQIGSINWGMLGVTHALAGGRVQLRGMASLDPFTVGGKGYPLLLQTGESYRGEALHDRQHPHDLFMEVATLYDRALTKNAAVQLYLAPVGEPAVGPPAFPHRSSGMTDPFAPISHHWQDATHISFGVVTAALYTGRMKLETSLFNAREPDDVRTNFDLNGARLDSRAVRFTLNPGAGASLSMSGARLVDAERAHPGETVRRATASVLLNETSATTIGWSFAAIVGGTAVGHDRWSKSMTMEGARPIGARVMLFSRLVAVQKSAAELVLRAVGAGGTHGDDQLFAVTAVSLGATRELHAWAGGSVGVGARGTVNVIPNALRAIYGSRTPLGATIFVRWRPSRMVM